MPPQLPSERKFGWSFAGLFAGLAAYGFWKGGGLVWEVSFLTAAALFGGLAFFAPRFLRPLNKAWFLVGQGIGKIVSPIVMGAMFFGLLTPIAAVCRLMGCDELRLKRGGGSSYWIDRVPPGPDAASFKNQF